MQLGAIPPTEYTESYWADPRKVLTSAQIDDAYHHYLEAGIQRSGYIIAALYCAYAILHWWLLSPPIQSTMVIAAASSALLIAGITYTTRTMEFTPFVTQMMASFMIWLVLGNSLLHLYLSREIWQTTNLIITIIALGFFFLTPFLYVVHLTVVIACWGFISLMIGKDTIGSNLLGHYQLALVTSVVLSYIIQNILSHLVKRVAALRVRDDAQKQALQQALQSMQ